MSHTPSLNLYSSLSDMENIHTARKNRTSLKEIKLQKGIETLRLPNIVRLLCLSEAEKNLVGRRNGGLHDLPICTRCALNRKFMCSQTVSQRFSPRRSKLCFRRLTGGNSAKTRFGSERGCALAQPAVLSKAPQLPP